MYKYVWTTPKGEKKLCSIQRDVGDRYVIRTTDPYDPGELEFEVPTDQVEPDFPKPTHTFVDSSMYGSYINGCHVIRDLPNGQKLIAYWDGFIEERCEKAVDLDDLTLISADSPAEAAFKLAFEGYQYGEDETADAKAWFMSGYAAGKRA